MNMRTIAPTLVLLLAPGIAMAQPPVRPADQPRSVTLSLAEYNRMLDLARQAPAAPATAPVAAVVAGADLRVTIDRDTARGVFNLTGEVLQSGITHVPLLSEAAIVDARSGGRAVPLVAENQELSALIAGPGPFTLAMDWAAPLVFSPGRAVFSLPALRAGAVRAAIDLPGEQAEVRLSSGLITRRSVANGRTIIDATLPSGAPIDVSWSMRDTAPVAAAKDVRALGEVMTLITLGDADVRMSALIDIAVIQGELRTLTLRLPDGYELQTVTGSSLEQSTPADRELVLSIGNPAARSHQFLVTLERSHPGGTFTLDTGLVSLPTVQRERGEIGIEGVGTMELGAADRAGIHRIDVRELNPSLHALSRLPILSAFRYQRAAGAAPPQMAFTVTRFDDARVLAAVANHAMATTLVTTEGRALTEISLEMRNRSQPFLKVELPPGATIVSVDLAGKSVKPASGPDGTRIPLMRAGLMTNHPYTVSFVYVHAGAPFQKKGDIEMALPKMDVPIGLVGWEMFVPEQYSVRTIGGNVIDTRRFPIFDPVTGYRPIDYGVEIARPPRLVPPVGVLAGQIRGRVMDSSGAELPGVTARLRVGNHVASATSQADGGFIFSGVPNGQVEITTELAGFATQRTTFAFDGRPRRIEIEMRVAGLQETIAVTGQAAVMERDGRRAAPPSENVIKLQARAAGVLPIRVDVPRAGVSHTFVKPLVVGDSPTVRLKYSRN